MDKPPVAKEPNKRELLYLKIDGTYFGRWGCLLAYKANGKFIYWNFVKYENFFDYRYDLSIIKSRYDVLGVTSDWHGSLVSAVKGVFGEYIPHQRCLVHLQRRIETLLTKNPKTEAGKKLLEVAKEVNHIESKKEAGVWLKWLEIWAKSYEYLTRERSYGINTDTGKDTWWYTHKNLRAAYRTIITTKEHLFLHFDYEGLDKDTNGLEVEFRHLKNKIEKHGRLTRKRKVSLMFWYLHFKNKERS